MGITSRSLLGAGLAGVGAALQNYSAAGIKRRQLADTRDFEVAKLLEGERFKQEEAQRGALNKLTDNLATHPDQMAYFLQAAQADPLLARFDLGPLKAAASGMGQQQLTSAITSAASPEAMPSDLGTALAARTGQPVPSMPIANLSPDAAMFGAQADYPDVPPALNTVMNTAASRLGQLRQAEEDKTNLLSTRKQGESYATAMGTGEAAHALAPTVTADEVAKETALGPVKATNAGLTTGAQIDAGLTPERVQGEAAKAGAVKGASERAGLAPDIVAGQARAAAAKTSAEERARLAAEYDPINIANAATLAGEKAKAEAIAKGDTGKLKYIESAKENGVVLGAQLQRLQNLYDKATQGDVQAMSLYSDLSNNLRPVIARASGYNGRMTNTELGIAGSAIPGLKDALLGTAGQKFKYIKGLATYGPTVAAKMPADASIDEYLSAVQRLVDQEPAPSGKAPQAPPAGQAGAPPIQVMPGSTLNRLLGQQ